MYRRPNFMNDFMQGYAFVDSVQRANRAEQRGLEKQKRDEAWQDEQRGYLRENQEYLGQQRQDEEQKRRAASILYRMEQEGANFKPTEEELQWAQQNMGENNPFAGQLESPEAAKQSLGQINSILGAFEGRSGKKEAIEAFNALYRGQLNKGNGGTDKQVREVYPSPDGKGFVLELAMKDEQGKDKLAPMTERRSSDPDDPVKVLSGTELITDLQRRKRALETYLVALGDTSPIQAQKEAQKVQREREAVLDERAYLSGEKEKQRGWEAKQKELDRQNAFKIKGLEITKKAKEANIDNNAYKLFDDQLNKQFLSEFMAQLPTDAKFADFLDMDPMGGSRVDMARVVAKMPEDMRERYNKARQQGELFLRDGGLAPVIAANKAYEFAAPKQSARPSLDQIFQ